MPKISPAVIADMIKKGMALNVPYSKLGPDGLLLNEIDNPSSPTPIVDNIINSSENEIISSSKKRGRPKNALRELLPEEKK